MVHAMPALRRFAKKLAGNADRAEDLVQEALVRGIANISSFQPGTNMEAWLLTILRNLFLTQCRQRRQDLAYKATLRTARSSSHAHQYSAVQMRELEASLADVPAAQREALLLVFAYGYSYGEAAAICRCPAGTIKSRVNRARLQVAKLMHVDGADEFGPGERELAVIASTKSGGMNQERFN
jgi:RNA polymerase sigma-70 factor (ECF subfamily)